jgi:phosphohistidine phosphatase
MKTLLLMRHAKSSWRDHRLSDHDRPLNSRGMKAAPLMGELLSGLDISPDMILCSTAKRAKQTVEYLLQRLPFEGEVIYSRMLYHAGDEIFSEELRKLPSGIETAMIVGHNPGMEYALENYCGEWHRMPTATIAQIEFEIVEWEEIEVGAEGKLMGLWRPKELP